MSGGEDPGGISQNSRAGCALPGGVWASTALLSLSLQLLWDEVLGSFLCSFLKSKSSVSSQVRGDVGVELSVTLSSYLGTMHPLGQQPAKPWEVFPSKKKLKQISLVLFRLAAPMNSTSNNFSPFCFQGNPWGRLLPPACPLSPSQKQRIPG